MNEMVERVARAIGATHERDAPVLVALEELARAAIAAMREPTAAMVEAGWPLTGDPCWEKDVAAAYRAMVDTALAD